MPPQLKRKRPHGEWESRPAAPSVAAAAPTAGIPRRATRQSSIPPLPAPPDPEPRRRRRRRPDADGQPTEPSQTSSSPRGKENIPVQIEQHPQPPPKLSKTTRLTRHSAGQDGGVAPRPSSTNLNRAKPTTVPTAAPSAPMPSAVTQRPLPSRAAGTPAVAGRPGRPIEPPIPHQHSVSVGRSKPIFMTTSVTQPSQLPTSTAAAGGTNKGAHGRTGKGTASGVQTDRNIDKVVLGNICFRAWYPSYYGKDVLGDISGSSTTKGGKDGKSNGTAAPHHHYEAKDDPNGAKAHGGRRDTHHPPMLDRLYVCPCCFKYSKELVTWWEHVRACERRGFIPGDKIYIHPKGRRTVLVPAGPAPKQGRGKRGSTAGQRMVEEVVQDEGEWSVWEVDGENNVLFCQNLSLFAKLFLDNKSVFFDVTGFKYYLLVHTPPSPPIDPDADVAPIIHPRGQIVGFFSKEKMSWDNNNLACILIFPPWQRKGLGALLMGVSYEISRREGVLGGPEKPISDLGKKGYKRYWGGEIARWLLSLDVPPPQDDPTQSETVVDVGECSKATWIAPEDALLVLREMGVAEEAGMGPPRVQEAKVEETVGTGIVTANGGGTEPVEVPRVRITKAAVRAWVAANKISLERTCDSEGFVEGYGRKPMVSVSEEPL